MTILRTSALAAALVGAAGLGMWARPYVISDKPARASTERAAVARSTSTTAPSSTDAVATKNDESVVRASVPTPRPWLEPALTNRLKPIVPRGANMESYSQGFPNAERFAAVLHASHNTGVPFMVLKDRVINQRMSLARAIRSMQPESDWKLEAQRAEIEAKADVFATRPLF